MRKIIFPYFLLLSATSFGQIADSTFAKYASEFTPEKTYLHFDKSAYYPGETVWFKAYLLAGNAPTDISKNFYADWYDEKGKLLQHIVAPIIASTARNQFEIPFDYLGKVVTVKAYTQWMLNFDTAFVFSKTIPVFQKKSKEKPPTVVKTKIDFLPESGDLVVGLQSIVAFKAVGQNGEPVSVTGSVTDNTGRIVAEFSSVHDGMGNFAFRPEASVTYIAQWTTEYGEKGSTTLPAPRLAGVVLHTQTANDYVRFQIQKTETASELDYAYIIATVSGQRIYQARVNLSQNSGAAGYIPVDQIPDGVVVVTLFTKTWKPVAERAVFVRRRLPAFDALIRGKLSAARRAGNELEIDLVDTLTGSFSVAVTDADVFTDSTENIFSQLLLSADVRGKIHNPAFYFQNTADSTLQYLDLVMMTNGWRRIRWPDLTANRLPKLWFEPETEYMHLAGKVFGAKPEQLRDVGELILLIQRKDSSIQLFQAPLAPNGAFSIPQLTFYDTLKVFYQFNKKTSLGAGTTTRFDNGFRTELYKRLLAETNIAEAIPADLLAEMQRYAADQAAMEKLLKGTTLENVTVKTRKKDPLRILDEKYTSGLFSGGDAYQIDVMNDPFAAGQWDVFSYLRARMPGMQVSSSAGNTPSISWRGGSPSFFLDEMQVESWVLSGISMNDIAYIKIFRAPFYGAFGAGAGGAIAVYLKKVSDIKNAPGKGLEYQYVGGYTELRQFYSPDYSSKIMDNTVDTRSTIYWNPDVFFGPQNMEIKLSFYNNDISKKLRIVIQGMNEEGKFFYYTRIIQ